MCYEPAQLELFEIFHLKMNCKLQNPFQIATHKAKVLLGMVLLKKCSLDKNTMRKKIKRTSFLKYSSCCNFYVDEMSKKF